MFVSATRLSLLPLLGFVSVLSLVSCSKSSESSAPGNRITFNDFEAVEGWSEPNPSLTTVKAHSGRYSIKANREVEYSMGYTNLLGRASATKIQKLIVRGWVYAGGAKATTGLVVQILAPNNNNQQIFWQSIDLRKLAGKTNEWREFQQELTLPANVEASHRMKVYMWSGGVEDPTYLDDLELLRGE